MKANDFLRTYLQDHHAGATAGVELARRAASSNADHPSGPELARIADEIEADRNSLERVMEKLEADPSRLKDGAAWTAERLGRLKPNNRLVGYSPLSRVIELEGLVVGVTGKTALWEALGTAVGSGIEGIDFDALAARARDQRTRLEELRRAAAAEALAVE
ncbi:MAG TPA: hypothetical protein VHF58_00165 [Solirubrobacterales bacterium]|nr:hypothetical protein [Solirubrobacterales bacterium]